MYRVAIIANVLLMIEAIKLSRNIIDMLHITADMDDRAIFCLCSLLLLFFNLLFDWDLWLLVLRGDFRLFQMVHYVIIFQKVFLRALNCGGLFPRGNIEVIAEYPGCPRRNGLNLS